MTPNKKKLNILTESRKIKFGGNVKTSLKEIQENNDGRKQIKLFKI